MTTILDDAPVRNDELLDATLAWVEEHPDEWDQNDWHTCFAAHAALLAGGRWAGPNPSVYNQMEEENGVFVHVRERAMRVLGLTARQADFLFIHATDLDDVRGVIANIRDGDLTL
jgi:hypothetical protein